MYNLFLKHGYVVNEAGELIRKDVANAQKVFGKFAPSQIFPDSAITLMMRRAGYTWYDSSIAELADYIAEEFDGAPEATDSSSDGTLRMEMGAITRIRKVKVKL
jgi:hypothetical protein